MLETLEGPPAPPHCAPVARSSPLVKSHCSSSIRGGWGLFYSLLASGLTLTCSGNGCGRQGQAAVLREAWCVSMLSQSLCAPRTSPGPARAQMLRDARPQGQELSCACWNPPGHTAAPPSPFMEARSMRSPGCHLDQGVPLPREPRRGCARPSGQKHRLAAAAAGKQWLLVLQPRWRWARYTARAPSGVLCVTVIAVIREYSL